MQLPAAAVAVVHVTSSDRAPIPPRRNRNSDCVAASAAAARAARSRLRECPERSATSSSRSGAWRCPSARASRQCRPCDAGHVTSGVARAYPEIKARRRKKLRSVFVLMSVHQTVLCLTSEVRLSEFLLPFDLFVKCEKKLSNKRSAAIKPNIIDCSTSDLTDNCSYFELFVVLSANVCTEMAVYRIIDMYMYCNL